MIVGRSQKVTRELEYDFQAACKEFKGDKLAGWSGV